MSAKRGWYKNKPGYKEVGQWGWDDNRLWSKVEVSVNTNDCWIWHGSMSPSGALFGGWKNELQQMQQARRFIWMSKNNEDVSPYRVTLTCANQECVNPNHFELKPTNRPEKQLW